MDNSSTIYPRKRTSAALLLFKKDILSRTEKRTIHVLQNRTTLFALDIWQTNALTLAAERSIEVALSDLVLAVSPPRAGSKGFWVFLCLKDRRHGEGGPEERRDMAKQSQNKFLKRQKELERMRKASEKMARRQQQKKDNNHIEKEIE